LLYGKSRAVVTGSQVGAGRREGHVTTVSEDDVLLALARMAMDASVRASADVGGVSPVQLRALTALRQMGEVNLARLAEKIGVAVSTTSRLVDRLVGADWVARAPCADNRREIRLTLTDSGERLLRRYDERRVGLLKECLHRIPTERQEAVIGALTELTQVVPV
jgi:DNA-binding MarR family transcriptional regulator